MQDREPIHGISFESGQDVDCPDLFGLHNIEIPDPAETLLNNLSQQHKLDRKDPKVAAVLDKIRELKRDHPDNPNVKLRADHHIQTLLISQRK